MSGGTLFRGGGFQFEADKLQTVEGVNLTMLHFNAMYSGI